MTATVMWEGRAAEGRHADLIAWVDAHADPTASLFASEVGEPRVVLIDPTGRGLPKAPAELVARPAHTWRFTAVPRTGQVG